MFTKHSRIILTSLVAAAAMNVPVLGATQNALTTQTTEITESTELSDYAGTYSGNIFELAAISTQGFHKSTFNVYSTDADGNLSSKTSTNTAGDASVSLTNGSTTSGSQTLWYYFVGTGATSDMSGTYGHTLYVSSDLLSSGNVSTTMSFGPIGLGGLIVGASDNSFTTGRTTSAVQLTANSSSGLNMNIGADTTLQGSAIAVNTSGTWTVASGKTLTLSSTDGVSVANGASISVSGGGNVVISKFAVSTGTLTYDSTTTAPTWDGDVSSYFSKEDGTTLTVSSYGFDRSNFTGTVDLKNISSGSVNLADYGVSGSTLKVDSVTNAYLSSTTLAANLDVGSGGLTVGNGASTGSNSAGIFSGKLTGAGTITFDKWGNSASQLGGYKFTGDLTGFTGNIAYNQNNELVFGAATAAEYASTATATDGKISNIAGTGSIAVSTSAALTFNYAASDNVLALGNSSITASSSTVTFGGGANYSIETDLTAGTLAITNGSTASIAAGKTVSFTNLKVGVGSGTITYDGGLAHDNMTYTSDVVSSAITKADGSSVDISGVITVASGFTGTVELKNITASTNLVDYGVSGSTLKVDSVSNASLSGATLAADLEIGSGGLTVSNGNSNSASILSGKITGTGTLTKTGAGTLVLSNDSLSLSNVSVSTGTLQITNSAEGASSTKTLSNATLADGTTLRLTQNDGVTTTAMTAGALTLESGATANLQIGSGQGTDYSGYWKVNKLSGSGTLNVVGASRYSNYNVVEFAGESDFTGTIAASMTTNGAARRLSIVLSSEKAASGAVIDLSGTTANDNDNGTYLALGINADKVSIAGLRASGTVSGNSAYVYSGAATASTAFDTGLSTLSSDAARTLTIDTAAGTSYDYAGTILANVNLVKDGAGTQTLSGASTAFDGTVEVKAGVLALGNAAAIGTGTSVTIDGGQLSIASGVTLNLSALTIALGDAYSSDAAIVGEGSLTLADAATITLTKAEEVAIAFSVDEATKSYQIFGTSLAGDFSTDNFSLGEGWDGWQISDYDSSTGVLTLSIPEPSAFGLLAGVGALALVAARRRRRSRAK